MGGAENVRAYLRESRREHARTEAMREARKAYRRALRVAGVSAVAGLQTLWPFPCAQLCDGCGLLHWSEEATAGDPHRRLIEAGSLRCSHCGGKRFIDLQVPTLSEALVASETYDRRASRRLALRIAGSVGVVGLAAVASFVAANALPAFGAVVGLFGLASISLLVDWVRVDMPKRALPRRWSMALPPHGQTVQVASGTVAADTTLVAPLSGRPCVAYEVAVRHDAKDDAKLSTWSLVEQRNVALEVGGTEVDANAVHLDLRRERLVNADPARVQQYMHERGLDPHAVDLVIYETIVEPGGSLRLQAGKDGALVATR